MNMTSVREVIYHSTLSTNHLEIFITGQWGWKSTENLFVSVCKNPTYFAYLKKTCLWNDIFHSIYQYQTGIVHMQKITSFCHRIALWFYPIFRYRKKFTYPNYHNLINHNWFAVQRMLSCSITYREYILTAKDLLCNSCSSQVYLDRLRFNYVWMMHSRASPEEISWRR